MPRSLFYLLELLEAVPHLYKISIQLDVSLYKLRKQSLR